ncbi:MAG: hypothetical protein GC136_10225 [Alphaproteobacteria bacterium]|nr:hypothetical protein [Alphaproteobacteria bacterium]
MDNKYYCIDQLMVKEGMMDKIIPAFEVIAEMARKCKGCEAYEVFQASTDPYMIVLYERWTTEADFMAHLEVEGMRDICKARNEFLATHMVPDLYFKRVV